MSKRWISVLITVLAVMLLTGCNADKKAVTESAEGFLNALVNNDMDAASTYATEEFMNSDTMKLMDPEYLSDSFYAAMNVDKEDLDETAHAAVDEYVKSVVEKAYQSYEVQDVKIQEDTAAVTCRITLGYDPDASSGIPDSTRQLISQYQTDHYDELITIYTDEGEKAMFRKLYSDLIPIVIGQMKEQLESAEPSEEKTILTLEKRDGKWLVTDLEENRPNAGAGSTASEESAAAASTAGPAEYADESVTSSTAEYATEEEPAQADTAATAQSTEGETGE